MSTPRLGINIDHIATLRQARGTRYPDPVHAAAMAEIAGADQITIHLREDRRHIQDRDLEILRQTVSVRLNLEMAATDEMIDIAIKTRPHVVTLVPESREEKTTEGGLNLIDCYETTARAVMRIQEVGIPCSLFINPDPSDIDLAKKMKAAAVELHTGYYADAEELAAINQQFSRLKIASQHGKKLEIPVHAGHGLHYQNTARLLQIKEIEEYNIGHAIVARAVFVGFKRAVSEMKHLLASGRQQ